MTRPSHGSLLVITVALGLGVLGVAAATADSPQQRSRVGADRPNPCDAIQSGTALPSRANNALLRAGLSSDQLPAAVFESFSPGGFYCLADRLSQRVDAVFIEFWDGDDVALRWLIAHPQAPYDSDYWADYLASLDSRPSTSATGANGQVVSAVNGTAAERQLPALTTSTQTVSAWSEVAPALAEHNE